MLIRTKKQRVKKTNILDHISLKKTKSYVLGIICAVLAIVNIFMTIDTSTNGREVAALQKKESDELTRQQELRESLVTVLSINNLQEQSSARGFVKVNTLVYVTDTEPVAKLP